MKPIIYIFNGPPGSGKSTLSSIFSHKLSLELIEKDSIKVSLYEQYGFKSNYEKRLLDEIAENIFYLKFQNLIDKQKNFIVDKWFTGIDRISQLNGFDKYDVTEFKLNCQAVDLQKRLILRMKDNLNRFKVLVIENQFPINEKSLCKNISLLSLCSDNLSKTCSLKFENSKQVILYTNRTINEVLNTIFNYHIERIIT
jgi:adenylate kinase family enzyme